MSFFALYEAVYNYICFDGQKLIKSVSLYVSLFEYINNLVELLFLLMNKKNRPLIRLLPSIGSTYYQIIIMDVYI